MWVWGLGFREVLGVSGLRVDIAGFRFRALLCILMVVVLIRTSAASSCSCCWFALNWWF